MVEKIIEKYNSNTSIENIAKEFKVGKIKIKQILLDNNIPIKKKGGQVKYSNTEKITPTNSILSCKNCNKEFNDIENKSGSLTNHIKTCFPNVIIPTSFKRRMFLKHNGKHWHLDYYNIIDKPITQTITCLECGWETKDIDNKTGSLTKHVEVNHMSVEEYTKKYPSEYHLFPTFVKLSDINEYFKNDENFVKCELCDEIFKTISSTHLQLHNTTPLEYKRKFGEDSLLSNTTKLKFQENLILNNPTRPTYRSKSEIEICDYLISLGVTVITSDKKQLSGTEIDIFLPEYNIAIEYNGLYWHSEKQGKHKNYHLNKTKKCLEKNIRLIHIFSDEWLSKKELIKKRLYYLTKQNQAKIYGRNCKIIELTKKQKSTYLNENHIQGNDKSSIYLGLTHNDEIVSVMTFGKLRKLMGHKNINHDDFELYRFCSNNVIGGFSKLLKYFVKNYNPHKIITYANRNWSPSDDFCFYSNMGFNYVGETKPNYYYTKKYDFREYRYNYRKDILVKKGYDINKSETQIMNELGYDVIWDTGNLKYEMFLK